MNPYFEEFLEEFSPKLNSVKPSPSELKMYQSELPEAILNFWAEVGWSGYANGIMWSSDPQEFKPILSAWLGSVKLFKEDTYNVIARSAFGKIFLWGKNTGNSIIIDSLLSSVTTLEPRLNPEKADAAIIAFFLSKDKDDFDFDDYKEKPLFARALKKLGPLSVDEMYGFEPALSIGGMPKLENLAKVKMIEHLELLSQFGSIEITHLDISRHVGI